MVVDLGNQVVTLGLAAMPMGLAEPAVLSIEHRDSAGRVASVATARLDMGTVREMLVACQQMLERWDADLAEQDQRGREARAKARQIAALERKRAAAGEGGAA